MGRLDDILGFIAKIEQLALDANQAFEAPLHHYFSHGIYAREIKLQAGTLIVGKIHKFENLNILSEGEASVFSIDGCMRIKAPHTFVGSVGSKRIIYAHSDLTWTTIHATSETDVDKIERDVIVKSYDELGEKWLGSSSAQLASERHY